MKTALCSAVCLWLLFFLWQHQLLVSVRATEKRRESECYHNPHHKTLTRKTMSKTNNCIQFKLKDLDQSFNKVNVAGTFNDWSPTSKQLSFDDSSKNWILEVIVNLAAGEKVLYKYVVNGTEWIHDKNEPYEIDTNGNLNNVCYVILKDSPIKTDDEIFDHKDLHDNELFDSINNTTEMTNSTINKDDGTVETAPTSGDENFTELVVTAQESANNDPILPTIKSTGINSARPIVNNELPKTAQNNYQGTSLWESIKWFFKYYIFAWFYP